MYKIIETPQPRTERQAKIEEVMRLCEYLEYGQAFDFPLEDYALVREAATNVQHEAWREAKEQGDGKLGKLFRSHKIDEKTRRMVRTL